MLGDDTTVLIVRLKSGEEVLCTTSFVDENHIKLKKPYLILPSPNNNDSLMIMPFMHYSINEEVVVERDFIAFYVEPQQDFATMYLEKSGSIVRSNTLIQ